MCLCEAFPDQLILLVKPHPGLISKVRDLKYVTLHYGFYIIGLHRNVLKLFSSKLQVSREKNIFLLFSIKPAAYGPTEYFYESVTER